MAGARPSPLSRLNYHETCDNNRAYPRKPKLSTSGRRDMNNVVLGVIVETGRCVRRSDRRMGVAEVIQLDVFLHHRPTIANPRAHGFTSPAIAGLTTVLRESSLVCRLGSAHR
jgi:hypothetical protein